MKKKFLKIQFVFTAVLLTACSIGFAACTWFESPQGEAEVVSVHTAEDDVYRYCFAEVKITNTGKCDIYSSNISVQASSNKSTYYKSASLATTIAPGNSIYITMDFTIPLDKDDRQTVTTTTTSYVNNNPNREIWHTGSVRIVDNFFD